MIAGQAPLYRYATSAIKIVPTHIGIGIALPIVFASRGDLDRRCATWTYFRVPSVKERVKIIELKRNVIVSLSLESISL